ncbi:MAG TPA: helix-turn-helix transcriptional regulator, partial [Gammaproteobacteria bacterium]|nr:helix-turn-helix transcriptional regulator [Gammaproteobacteria bacterium]
MKWNRDVPGVDQHLQELSERIRALRAGRGMTRKNLSRHSGISERYLAQLESGGANPSVALLWQIAQALDVGFHDLVGERAKTPLANGRLWDLLQTLTPADQQLAYDILAPRFGYNRGTRHGIALIGLRGAGKTTLGQHLASLYQVPFIRLSSVIEAISGMDLGELLSLGGQKAYRRTERQALEQVIREHPLAVVEAGGSLVSELSTFNLLRSAYFTIWVRARPEDHMNRVIRQGDTRPMEGNHEAMDDLRRILTEREPHYSSADYQIDTTGRS